MAKFFCPNIQLFVPRLQLVRGILWIFFFFLVFWECNAWVLASNVAQNLFFQLYSFLGGKIYKINVNYASAFYKRDWFEVPILTYHLNFDFSKFLLKCFLLCLAHFSQGEWQTFHAPFFFYPKLSLRGAICWKLTVIWHVNLRDICPSLKNLRDAQFSPQNRGCGFLWSFEWLRLHRLYAINCF